eukprot:401024-Prymnesium_polylepis.1
MSHPVAPVTRSSHPVAPPRTRRAPWLPVGFAQCRSDGFEQIREPTDSRKFPAEFAPVHTHTRMRSIRKRVLINIRTDAHTSSATACGSSARVAPPAAA